MKNFPTTCIDNFYDDPESVREYALSLDYHACPNGTFPGLRSEPIHQLNLKLLTVFCKRLFSTYYDLKNTPVTWEVTSYFQKIYPMQGESVFKNTGWIHKDSETVLAGVVYLNESPKNLDCGTALYDLKPEEFEPIENDVKHAFFKGEQVDPEKYDSIISTHNSKFVETAKFNSVFNRAIAYDGDLYHGVPNFDTGEEFRLTQVFFIKRVIAQHTPIPRMKEYNV